MARHIVIAATVAVILASVVLASNYHATITTVEINDENPRQSQRCQQQIQRQQQLNTCQRYLRDSSRVTSMLENQGGWREEFPRCCAQLEQIDEQCRCEAVKQVVQQQQGELQGRERREMLQTAQSLPSLCRIRPQRCDVGGSWV